MTGPAQTGPPENRPPGEDAPGVADLGALDGPVLVFGGPVSNRQATEAVLAAAAARGIPAARMICTGDVAAYCAAPQATAACLRGAGIATVRGNCEDSLGAGADDCGCNFAAGSTCDLLAAWWYRHCLDSLDADSRAWMAARPAAIRFTLAGRTLLAVHGAPSAVSRWIFSSTPAREKALEIALAGVDGVIAGHSGMPFAELVNGHLWLNAGSVGLPANDGTPRGWYAVLAPEADGALSVSLHALTYDHPTAAARMRRDGLPEGYALALETGRWPSEDVLPPAERAGAGSPLADGTSLRWLPDAMDSRPPEPLSEAARIRIHGAACPCCA